METSQGGEKSASYCELNFSRVCPGHERHVFKDIFCLSSPGWYSWPNEVLEPHVSSGTHEIPRWIIQEDFCESNFVKSLNFRNKVLSKLFRLRCQFFLPFSLSPSLSLKLCSIFSPPELYFRCLEIYSFKAVTGVFTRYLLSTYYTPGTLLGTETTPLSKTDYIPAQMELIL